jgi:hypothetical protein
VASSTTARAKQRAFTIAVLQRGQDDLSELRELLRTGGAVSVGEMVQHREEPHPNTYLGAGKLEELKAELKRADANVVAVDDELTPRQERNLEKELGVPVVDRTAVILDIFASTRARPRASCRSSWPSCSTTWPACAACGRTWTRWPAASAARAAAPPPEARRAPDRDRPPPRARPHQRAQAPPRARSRPPARPCAPSASARTCRRSRSPATPTRASRRCSTR